MAARKKLKKLKKATNLVTDVVVEKAASLNPLTPRQPEVTVPDSVPRITDESIAEHREDVLSGARKYIYPLAHSKRRIINITITIIVATIAIFFTYCILGLYKLHQHNSFLYRVTQVVPFPIAKVDGQFVSYENYLFELRHYIYYYETQLQSDFNGADKQRLIQFRKQDLKDTIDAAYIKILAKQNNITVTSQEVDNRIAVVRNQDLLGSNDKVFSDVLRDRFGWSIGDFKRSLKQAILTEKVEAKLDTAANTRAENALTKLKAGTPFAAVAKRYSQDKRTRDSGGNYSRPITNDDPNIPPQVISALFSLKPGKTSDIIVASPVLANTPPTLEIVKVLKANGKQVTAQHISINLSDISTYLTPLEAKNPPHIYVHF